RKTGLGHGGLAARVQRRSSGTERCLRMRRLMASPSRSPVLTPCPLPRRLTPPSMSSPGNKKILIVEDEHDILQLVKLYVEKEGFRTVSAMTGTEALRQVKQEKPDLVVLDLMLPEIDGIEVCKRIRSAPETAMLPIIMLTAKAEES